MLDTKITPRQRAVLKRLARGWELDRAGREGLGGVLFRRDRIDVRVSTADMGHLLSECLIYMDHGTGLHYLTDMGKAFAKGPAT